MTITLYGTNYVFYKVVDGKGYEIKKTLNMS
jgi:hypothetical protein